MKLTLGSTMMGVLRTLLTLGWYLGAVGAPVYAGLTALAVLTPFSMSALSMSGSLSTEMRVRVLVDDSYPRLDQIIGWTKVETLPTGAALACVGLLLVGVLIWLPVIGRLRRLTESVLAEGPFVPRNIEQLGRLGVTVIVVSAISGLPTSAMSWVAATAATDGSAHFESIGWLMPLGWLCVGFVVAALAEVFRTGVELQADNELTI